MPIERPMFPTVEFGAFREYVRAERGMWPQRPRIWLYAGMFDLRSICRRSQASVDEKRCSGRPQSWALRTRTQRILSNHQSDERFVKCSFTTAHRSRLFSSGSGRPFSDSTHAEAVRIHLLLFSIAVPKAKGPRGRRGLAPPWTGSGDGDRQTDLDDRPWIEA